MLRSRQTRVRVAAGIPCAIACARQTPRTGNQAHGDVTKTPPVTARGSRDLELPDAHILETPQKARDRGSVSDARGSQGGGGFGNGRPSP